MLYRDFLWEFPVLFVLYYDVGEALMTFPIHFNRLLLSFATISGYVFSLCTSLLYTILPSWFNGFCTNLKTFLKLSIYFLSVNDYISYL